jgi:hypothetical protein
MVTRAQIDRIATRIEALAPKSNRVVYVWRNVDETAEEVLERHYAVGRSLCHAKAQRPQPDLRSAR